MNPVESAIKKNFKALLLGVILIGGFIVWYSDEHLCEKSYYPIRCEK